MTTLAAADHYRFRHIHEMEGKPIAVFNPHNKPVEELPIIYGFNNGGPCDWLSGVLLAEDGVCLGGHICSHEAYMPHDLGILEGTRPDRHEKQFRPHYPDGYIMEFVPFDSVKSHKGLMAAYKKNQEAVSGQASEKDIANDTH